MYGLHYIVWTQSFSINPLVGFLNPEFKKPFGYHYPLMSEGGRPYLKNKMAITVSVGGWHYEMLWLTRWFSPFPVGTCYILQRASGFSKNETLFLPWRRAYAGMAKRLATWPCGTEDFVGGQVPLGRHWGPYRLKVSQPGPGGWSTLVLRVCAIPDPSPALAPLEEMTSYTLL